MAPTPFQNPVSRVDKMIVRKSVKYLRIALNFVIVIVLTYTVIKASDRSSTIKSFDVVKLTQKNKPLIIFWTKWFNDSWPVSDPLNCGKRMICRVRKNTTQYRDANAVVFHGCSMAIKQLATYPDVSQKPKNQLWIYHSLENPIINERQGAGATTSIHNNIFNVLNTYTHNSQVLASYGTVVKGHFSRKYDPNKNYAKGKTKLIAWASSSCYPGRTNFVKVLAQHIKIDSYGKCGNISCPGNDDCWAQIAKEHKFYLSFENFICRDYVTEKFYSNALFLDMIPIVAGGANYSDRTVAPPNSYINVFDFKNMKELAAYIYKVANNDTLYNSYFRWQSTYRIKRTNTVGSICGICEKLHDRKWVERNLKQTILDMSKEWGDQGKHCIDYPQDTNDFHSQKFPWL